MHRPFRLLLSLALLAMFPRAAAAQAISTTEPARLDTGHVRWDAAGTGLAVVPSTHTLALGQISGGVTLHVSDRPLVLRRGTGESREPWATLLESVVQTDLFAAIGFGPGELGLVLPLAPVAIWGIDPTGGSFPTPGLDAGAVGDLVLIPKLRVLDAAKRRFGLAVQVPVSLPTGMSARYMGSPLPSVAVDVLMELVVPRFRALVALSPVHLQRRVEWADWTRFYSFDWKAGVGIGLADKLELRLEGWGSVHPLGTEERASIEASGSVISWPTEFLALEVGLGGGTGLGVPRFRAMAGVRVMVPGSRWPPAPASPEPAMDDGGSEPAPAASPASAPSPEPTASEPKASEPAPAESGPPSSSAPASGEGSAPAESSPAPAAPTGSSTEASPEADPAEPAPATGAEGESPAGSSTESTASPAPQ